MSRPDTGESEGLRDIFGFTEEFDVVLSCAFEPEENGDTRFDLYNQIGDVVRSVGKRPYIPHREIDLKWPPEKVYSIPNSIVIPTSDVVLCYLGLSSTAAGIMLGSAIRNRIPIIYLIEKQGDFDLLKMRADTHTLSTGIVDRGIIDARSYGIDLEFGVINVGNRDLGGLEDCLNKFYEQFN